uniref:Uncharacterized protein n=1 Tax=Cucumis melo TaxID=3656 RepID=A0A9I9CUK1_CUCME
MGLKRAMEVGGERTDETTRDWLTLRNEDEATWVDEDTMEERAAGVRLKIGMTGD